MMTVDLLTLRGGIAKPELYFGVVAAVGTATGAVESDLRTELEAEGYSVETIRLTSNLQAFRLKHPYPNPEDSQYDRVNKLIDRADELRHVTGRSEALALMAAADISSRRPRAKAKDRNLDGCAFIFHQLKHPEEVLWLRHIYGDAFHLLGLYSPGRARKQFLTTAFGMGDADAERLIKRDEGRDEDGGDVWGQQLRSTFHRSDVFIEMRDDTASTEHARRQVKRFVDLLFGRQIITPTRHEYGMYLAHAAALRSADLSRQVGASVVDVYGELVAVGANEVPAFGGGQYWGEDDGDARDYCHNGGADSNEVKKAEAMHEILTNYDAGWPKLSLAKREGRLAELGKTRVANLTEFGRAVHAEMEVILSAARRGVSIRGSTLFTTTFPCHNCAKHIVGAGISEVLYIEPYPKSLAGDLHPDSIAFAEDISPTEAPPRKVRFSPFVGVAPRRYSALFSALSEQGERIKRKEKGGKVSKKATGLRLRAEPLSHIEREAMAALAAKSLAPTSSGGGKL